MGGLLFAQPPAVFRINVTSYTTKAINYQHRSGATKIDFQGSPSRPHVEAKVQSKQGLSKSSSATCNRHQERLGVSDLCLRAVTPELSV